jgi:hypothetical protein
MFSSVAHVASHYIVSYGFPHIRPEKPLTDLPVCTINKKCPPVGVSWLHEGYGVDAFMVYRFDARLDLFALIIQ